MKRRTRGWIRGSLIGAVISLLLIWAGACGRSEDAIPEGAQAYEGNAMFTAQCPYGSTGSPTPTTLALYDCDGHDSLKIQAPPSLTFSANCKERTLLIRSADRSVDILMNVMPDNNFDIVLDTARVQIADDGAGTKNCTAYSALEVVGKMNCPASGWSLADKITVDIDAYWWLGQGKGTAPGPGMGPGAGKSCNLSSKCYLRTTKRIRQC